MGSIFVDDAGDWKLVGVVSCALYGILFGFKDEYYRVALSLFRTFLIHLVHFEFRQVGDCPSAHFRKEFCETAFVGLRLPKLLPPEVLREQWGALAQMPQAVDSWCGCGVDPWGLFLTGVRM